MGRCPEPRLYVSPMELLWGAAPNPAKGILSLWNPILRNKIECTLYRKSIPRTLSFLFIFVKITKGDTHRGGKSAPAHSLLPFRVSPLYPLPTHPLLSYTTPMFFLTYQKNRTPNTAYKSSARKIHLTILSSLHADRGGWVTERGLKGENHRVRGRRENEVRTLPLALGCPLSFYIRENNQGGHP